MVTVNFADHLSFDMYPTDSGYYADQSGPQVVAPGDRISVSATGDEIPAFSASIVEPGPLRLISPAVGDYGELAVLDNADLELTFTGGAPGVQLGVTSQGGYTTGGTFLVQCSYASQAGRALIPKGALYYSSYVSLHAYREKAIRAGAYAIDLISRNAVLDAAGVNGVHIDVFWTGMP